MLIDDIRKTYAAIRTDVYSVALSADDKERCEKARELLFQAVSMLAPVETKLRFPRWEYRSATCDGRCPDYRLEDGAIMTDRYAPPYTVAVNSGGGQFIRADTIQEALERAESMVQP